MLVNCSNYSLLAFDLNGYKDFQYFHVLSVSTGVCHHQTISRFIGETHFVENFCVLEVWGGQLGERIGVRSRSISRIYRRCLQFSRQLSALLTFIRCSSPSSSDILILRPLEAPADIWVLLRFSLGLSFLLKLHIVYWFSN